MKKYLSIIVALLLTVCFMLVGCSPEEQLAKKVSSNGGRFVMVDDYVYFANTFVDYTSLTGDANRENNVEYNAIFKIKTDENGYTYKDEDDRVTEVTEVYSKIAGFNNSNMFVVGNYLYFTSPNIHKENKTGNDKFDLTTLFRIKLDGTGFKEILTTETIQGKFFLVTEETPYLLIFDNNKISKLVIEENLKSAKTLVTDVADVVFPKEYGKISRILYTKDLTQNDQNSGLAGNYLYQYDLAQNKSVEVVRNSQAITLAAFENNTLYYTQDDGIGGVAYYSSKFIDGAGADQVQWTIKVDSIDDITGFVVINENAVAYKTQSKLFLGKKGATSVAGYELFVNEDATIELVDGEYVYYSTTAGIYRKSYRQDQEAQTVATITNIKSGAMEIAGEYIYFYAKMETDSTGTYYAYRANIKTPGLVHAHEKVECIASVDAQDLTDSTEEE